MTYASFLCERDHAGMHHLNVWHVIFIPLSRVDSNSEAIFQSKPRHSSIAPVAFNALVLCCHELLCFSVTVCFLCLLGGQAALEPEPQLLDRAASALKVSWSNEIALELRATEFGALREYDPRSHLIEKLFRGV